MTSNSLPEPRSSGAAQGHARSWPGLVLGTTFFAAFLVLVFGGCLYISHIWRDTRTAAHRELASIAQLKLKQIHDWREERLADARFFSKARFVAEDLKALMAQPESPRLQSRVLEWLALLKGGERYSAVIICDAHGARRLAVPAASDESLTNMLALTEHALRTRAPVMSELQGAGSAELNIAFPVFEDANAERGKVLAVVLLEIDARQYLFPVVREWPGPTRTGEILLVRREGDEVRYLSSLRHRQAEELPLRLPLNSPELPAGKILRGQDGVIEGLDYQGTPVLAAGGLVAQSAWAIVVKIDRAEAYATLYQQVRLAVLFLSALFVAGLLLLGLLWRQRLLNQERRKNAESQLALQAAALQAAANAIVITGNDGVMQWVNPAFERLTGYSAAEALGKSPRLLNSGMHGPAFFRTMWQVISTGAVWHGEVVNKRKDGTLYTEEMTVTPVKNESGEIAHFVAIKQDVTARKEAERVVQEVRNELQRANAELERRVQERTTQLRESVAELESFAYSMSHDLRSPLRAISAFTSIVLADYGDKLGKDGAELLEKVMSAAARMDQLVTDVLALGRVSRSQMQIEKVDTQRLLNQIVHERPELQAPRAEVTLEPSIAPVLAHEALLTQCLTNLLGNAIKFVEPGVKPRVRVWSENTGRRTRIWIADNGIGIPREAHHKIFEIFQRLHTQKAYEGTGIGLAIVRKAVERMGGRVGVESEPGQGSRFWIELDTPQA